MTAYISEILLKFFSNKLNTHTVKLYESVPSENNDLEQRLDLKLNEVNSFNNSITKIKERITYFRDHKSRKKFNNYKTLTSVLESMDTVVIIGATTMSVTLSVIGVGLMVKPKSAGIAGTLSLGNKAKHKRVMNKNRTCKKQYEKDQRAIESVD